jgi:rhodanese-related sulfurtransferase
MKKMLVAVMLCATMGLASGCSAGGSPDGDSTVASYHKVSASQAKSMMDEAQEFTLVDVRTANEYTTERIAGAILIPVDSIKDRAAVELPDKGALIFVYCRAGNRSATASRALVSLGYTNVYDMGGIIDWPYGTTSG